MIKSYCLSHFYLTYTESVEPVDRFTLETRMNASLINEKPDFTRDVLSVSGLSHAIAGYLTRGFSVVRVRGELSGITRAGSGHIYFTLKDEAAALKCVMFRPRALLFGAQLQEGSKIELSARVTVYELRGDLQLVVDAVKPAGQGDLFAAFVKLKEKLAAEGLFDVRRKRPIPEFARRIGVVTSLDAAALRDLVTTFSRRAPHVTLIVYPAAVQGERASEEISRAIQTASSRHEIDLLIVARGGGSLEDLAAFNNESVARALVACSVPTISGVGHEIDFSICDFVADLRAATPTAAAEIATRAGIDWLYKIQALAQALRNAQMHKLDRLTQRMDELVGALIHPQEHWLRLQTRIQILGMRLTKYQTHSLHYQTLRLNQTVRRLAVRLPQTQSARRMLDQASAQLKSSWERTLSTAQLMYAQLRTRLNAADPMQLLARGYTFATDLQDQPVTSSQQVQAGQHLYLYWHDGRREVIAQVPPEF